MSVSFPSDSRPAGNIDWDSTESAFIEAVPSATSDHAVWPELAISRWWTTIAKRLGPQELKRRLWHIVPGLLPFFLWMIPHTDPLTSWWLLDLAMNAIVLGVAGCYFGRTFSRPGERNCLCAVIAYSTLVFSAILLFPGQLEIGMAVLAIIAFGDGSATLGGLLLRGPVLPWNREKTWAGSLCFLLGGVPMAALFYWGEARPGVPWDVALLCAGTAAVASAIAESAYSRINDNIRVGVTAILTMAIMNRFLLGWS